MNKYFLEGFEKQADTINDARKIFMLGGALSTGINLAALGIMKLTSPDVKENQSNILKYVDNANKQKNLNVETRFKDDSSINNEVFKSKRLQKAQKTIEPKSFDAFMGSKILVDGLDKLEDKIVLPTMRSTDKKIYKLEQEAAKSGLLKKIFLNLKADYNLAQASQQLGQRMAKEEDKLLAKAKKSKDLADVISLTKDTPLNIASHEYGHAIRAANHTPQEQITNRKRALALSLFGSLALPATHFLTKNQTARNISYLAPMLGSAPLLIEEGGATIQGATTRGNEKFKDILKNLPALATYASLPAGMTIGALLAKK